MGVDPKYGSAVVGMDLRWVYGYGSVDVSVGMDL